jgi:hypothetical protein
MDRIDRYSLFTYPQLVYCVFLTIEQISKKEQSKYFVPANLFVAGGAIWDDDSRLIPSRRICLLLSCWADHHRLGFTEQDNFQYWLPQFHCLRKLEKESRLRGHSGENKGRP